MGAVVTTCLGVSACDDRGDLRDQELAVAAPLQRAHVFRTGLFVALEPSAYMQDAVSLPISPLVPGMTREDAERLLGAPIAVRRDGQCTYYRFGNTPQGVEVSHCTGPGSWGGTWEKWRVAASPADDRVSAVFTDPVQELIHEASPITEITIHEGDERASTVAFSAKVVGGRVSKLSWYDITDFRQYEELHNNGMHQTKRGVEDASGRP
jgi:hypothetical protein